MVRAYTIGGCEVRPDERRVLVGGRPAVLGARAFDLLMCLIEHRDRVVTKSELMEMVWAGTVVEENNLTVHVSALRKLLGAQCVATVPGRGYRFAMEVSETDAVPRAPAALEGAPRPAAAPAAASAPREVDLPLPDKPSIAVLPFDNLGRDPEQECFIDGVTEDIITELSRFRSLFVIARNSTFSYKGKAVDVRTIAKDLGVRYVVEGSIRRAGSRIRVAAQLIDAPTGAHVWAEKYERALEDIFAVQEELTQAIVAAIAPQIESFEIQKGRGARAGNLNAYELAMRARDTARRADKEAEAVSHDEALQIATDAVAIDPNCGTAFGTIAYLRWRQVWAGTTQPARSIEEGLAAARRAITIDSGDHIAHLWKGMILLFADQHDAGLADLRRAHELNPNDALTLSLLGQFAAGAGDAQTGIRYAKDALRLSPRDTLRWSFLNSLAWAYFFGGDYANAADSALRSIGEAPRFYPSHLCLVVSRVGLGDTAQAAAELGLLQDLAPQAVATRIDGNWRVADAALAARATTFLRIAAGLEDPSAAHPRR
ncbi:MAG: winged helix-turn-helix domain-containing protein [Rhizobacter sp.]|nr:winged helix-turn-helix domain-containing protein [Rhizobacter sp.]